MIERQKIIGLLLLTGLLTAVPSAPAQAPTDSRLLHLEDRLGSRGSGLLFQYERGVQRLEDTLRRDEYFYLGRFVRNQVLAPWSQVEDQLMIALAADPPLELSPSMRHKLNQNTVLVRRVTLNLRRVRRLVTRAANQNQENRRHERELLRTLQQWERQVAVLQREDPRAASAHLDWMNDSYRPALDGVRRRDEQLRERFERLANWGEDGNLRHWLDQVGEVAAAVEKLNRLYR